MSPGARLDPTEPELPPAMPGEWRPRAIGVVSGTILPGHLGTAIVVREDLDK
jgi:hypothetical protein